ncbi:unnamed protein product, partial [marine sediment metagenome]
MPLIPIEIAGAGFNANEKKKQFSQFDNDPISFP